MNKLLCITLLSCLCSMQSNFGMNYLAALLLGQGKSNFSDSESGDTSDSSDSAYNRRSPALFFQGEWGSSDTEPEDWSTETQSGCGCFYQNGFYFSESEDVVFESCSSVSEEEIEPESPPLDHKKANTLSYAHRAYYQARKKSLWSLKKTVDAGATAKTISRKHKYLNAFLAHAKPKQFIP